MVAEAARHLVPARHDGVRLIQPLRLIDVTIARAAE